ncbi:MAG: hypothetical protein HZA22_00510 [Nitrospirae bacterium]|nr:hypothetical protein [Nitrospirota bacterium]
MEKELKEYLDKLSSTMVTMAADLTEVKATMATKDELAEVKATMATLATKDELAGGLAEVKGSLTKEIRKVERKLTKKLDDNIEYTKFLDKEICDHRKNTEAHNAGLRGA